MAICDGCVGSQGQRGDGATRGRRFSGSDRGQMTCFLFTCAMLALLQQERDVGGGGQSLTTVSIISFFCRPNH